MHFRAAPLITCLDLYPSPVPQCGRTAQASVLLLPSAGRKLERHPAARGTSALGQHSWTRGFLWPVQCGWVSWVSCLKNLRTAFLRGAGSAPRTIRQAAALLCASRGQWWGTGGHKWSAHLDSRFPEHKLRCVCVSVYFGGCLNDYGPDLRTAFLPGSSSAPGLIGEDN